MSLTINGLIVGVIAYLLKGADMPVVEGGVETFVQVAIALIGAGGVYWGRYRKGDINFFGGRK